VASYLHVEYSFLSGAGLVWPVAHFWSLAVEEQFYWLWPWVILYLPQRYLIGTVSVLAVSVPALRLLSAVFMPDITFVTMLPFAASDALAGGALIALLPRNRVLGTVWCGALAVGLTAWAVTGLSMAPWRGADRLLRAFRDGADLYRHGRACLPGGGSPWGGPCPGAARGVRGDQLWPVHLHPVVPIVWAVTVKKCGLPHLWTTSLPWRLAWCGTILWR